MIVESARRREMFVEKVPVGFVTDSLKQSRDGRLDVADEPEINVSAATDVFGVLRAGLKSISVSQGPGVAGTRPMLDQSIEGSVYLHPSGRFRAWNPSGTSPEYLFRPALREMFLATSPSGSRVRIFSMALSLTASLDVAHSRSYSDLLP